MAVIDVKKDFDALTLTITAEFDADIARVWELWADPRKLERWWGPPTYPVTFVDYRFVAGGTVSYYMTSPEGNRHHGWWYVVSLDARHDSCSRMGSPTRTAIRTRSCP